MLEGATSARNSQTQSLHDRRSSRA